MSDSVVRIQNAQKYYNKGRQNELHVMNDISLELPASGLVAIFGKSGCGKTTLLNAVGGLDKIASGSIELFGRRMDDARTVDMLRNRYIGYIFQNYNLNVNETVYDNVAAALRLCGMEDESEIAERVTASLRNVGMEKYIARTPDTLSGGQQQRVAIARALVKNPAIILADEPTGNLDEANTVLVMDILKEISESHLVLLVTHEAHLVDFYCDRVIEIVDGRIHGDRRNEGANGYVRRNKNDIYLGELEKSETTTPGVTLTRYGEPPAGDRPIGLTLVNHGGKLYLKCDDPTVKLLDPGSEIRLLDGVFNESPTPEEKKGNRNGHHIDMSRLTPVEGKHYGRLYHMGNAFLGAWREIYAKPRKKKGRGLRVVLVFLAVVLTFMTASIGAGFQEYIKLSRDHNDRLFYIPLDPEIDYSELEVAPGQNSVTHSRIVGSDPLYETQGIGYLTFGTAAFMTARKTEIRAGAYAQSVDNMPDLKVVAGTGEIKASHEILITTKMADELIESSTVGYIDSYRDLVGLVADTAYYDSQDRCFRIVGVVESSEVFFYMDGIALSHYLLNHYVGTRVSALSEVRLNTELSDGQMLYVHWVEDVSKPEYESPVREGDRIHIMGKYMIVGKVLVKSYNDMEALGLDQPISFFLTDADLKSLAYSIDFSADDGMAFYYKDDYGSNDPYYSNHLQIRSSNPDATAAYLNSVLGRDGYLTPDDMLAKVRANARMQALSNGLSVLIFLSLMCLCVFFVMRSSFMSRVREVGILRAIGVTRKNLLFRFGVEAGLLLLLTTGIAYLISSFFIMTLSDAPLFSSIFFFPPWLAIGMFAVIFAAGIFFGILPALILFRKTPSEILAKYDI